MRAGSGVGAHAGARWAHRGRSGAAFGRTQPRAKVLSGDRAETVASIAEEVGLRSAALARDGSELPDDPDELRKLVLETAGSAIAIFGLAATDDRFVPGRSH